MAILAIVWMYQDTKSRGKKIKYWLPFALITIVFVSIGPLLYLVLKLNNDTSHSIRSRKNTASTERARRTLF